MYPEKNLIQEGKYSNNSSICKGGLTSGGSGWIVWIHREGDVTDKDR